MTPADHRAQCIEAMAAKYRLEFERIWSGSRPAYAEAILLMTAAFDALNGIARVNPVEATQEMIEIGYAAYEHHGDLDSAFADMAEHGDLTRPPWHKP
jgi:hypothetical protein